MWLKVKCSVIGKPYRRKMKGSPLAHNYLHLSLHQKVSLLGSLFNSFCLGHNKKRRCLLSRFVERTSLTFEFLKIYHLSLLYNTTPENMIELIYSFRSDSGSWIWLFWTCVLALGNSLFYFFITKVSSNFLTTFNNCSWSKKGPWSYNVLFYVDDKEVSSIWMSISSPPLPEYFVNVS